MTTRAVLYVRVSKSDGSQSVENQRPEVEQIARARGFEVVHVYEEQGSAAKHRPIFEKMLADAWAIDRFGRSMTGNLQDVLELDRLGVTVVSVKEGWLDTGSPVRSLLVAIFSWVAEQERSRLIERTKAGLEAARRRGTHVGRPRARLDDEHLRELRGQGWSVRRIAAVTHIGTATVATPGSGDAMKRVKLTPKTGSGTPPD